METQAKIQRMFQELNMEIVMLNEVKGDFASNIYRGIAKNNQGKERSFIYKQFQKGREQEIEVYQKLSNLLKDWMPHVYGISTEEPSGILVKDLGISVKKKLLQRPLNDQMDCFRKILDTLADLHTTFHQEGQKLIEKKALTLYPYSSEWAYWSIQQLERLLQFRSSSPFLNDLQARLPAIKEMVHQFYDSFANQIRLPLTVTHGDPHLDNIFIQKDQVLFIDWEWIHLASPVRDLTILFQDIYDHQVQSELSDYYYKKLAKLGYPLNLEDYENDQRLCLLDNTIMMIGWDVELYFMEKRSMQELEEILQFKFSTMNQFHNSLHKPHRDYMKLRKT